MGETPEWVVAELRAELERLRAENDEATRVCDTPGCLSAVVRLDDGRRRCAAGHDSRWVDADELDRLRAQLARHAAVVEAARAVDGCDCPDHSVPLHWCTSCAAEGAVRERLERALAALDSTDQDPADAGGERVREAAVAYFMAAEQNPGPCTLDHLGESDCYDCYTAERARKDQHEAGEALARALGYESAQGLIDTRCAPQDPADAGGER